jgi:hypothetical protein
LNWEVVCSNIFQIISVIVTEVPGWSVIENSLLHFKSIGVSVEGLIVVEIKDLPLGNDFITIVEDFRERIKINIKFYALSLGVNRNMDDHFHLNLLSEIVFLFKVEVHELIT